jgi:hypothetical protein
MMPRAVLTVVAGCMVLAATAFLAVYTAINAIADETWPDLT